VKQLVFTPSAEADIFEIWAYIAEDNPEAADEIEANLAGNLRAGGSAQIGKSALHSYGRG
jgi:plasmid stabilization system protein ParE